MDFATDFEDVVVRVNRCVGASDSPRDDALFERAVRAWCEEMGWPPEAARLGLQQSQEQFLHLGRVVHAFDSAAREADHPGGQRKQNANRLRTCVKSIPIVGPALMITADDYAVDTTRSKAMSQMDYKDYLLIAFAVAAAGYAIYRLTHARTPATGRPKTASSSEAQRSHWVLVVVLNAERQQIIKMLREGGAASVDGDQLYQAAQALWFGQKDDFGVSALSSWFDDGKGVEETSEYDVHLVKLELDGDDRGLHRNANQMDRLDAFRRVKAKGYKCVVSPRLPSDAYGTTDVYSR